MINSYATVFAIGHKAIEGLFSGPVLVEEKIDGSSFSFGLIDGELEFRSKGKQLIPDAPEKMFVQAVENVRLIQDKLHPDWIYRCEYLSKPHHNTLSYSRVPNHNLILYDVAIGGERYLSPRNKAKAAKDIGLECVPVLFRGKIDSMNMFNDLLQTESILGGTKIEGIVVKNYKLFTLEKKVAMGKYVSEAFKEVHSAEWRKSNPTGKDIEQQLIDKYKTEARWQKAVQHLTELGILEGSPRDIGKLILAVPEDILDECEDEIKDTLFKHYWQHIRRGVTAGLPEWWKQKLAENAFEHKGE